MKLKSPKNQKTFTIKYKPDEPGAELVEGQFTVKRLSIRDRSEIGRRKSQLSGGMYCVYDDGGNPTGQGLDEDTDYLNAMIAHLEISLIQKPEWFDMNDIADLGLIREIYKEVISFESSFFRVGPKNESPETSESGRMGETNGGEQHQGSGPGNAPTQVVDQEVQAALDA